MYVGPAAIVKNFEKNSSLHFQLLQTMMQLPLELFIILDRAHYLVEHKRRVDIANAFEPGISPRNLCVIAQ